MRNLSGDRLSRWQFLLISTTACIIAAIPAGAHVHYDRDGTRVDWYPYECCHDGDCHPVSRLKSLADGFVMTTENGAMLFVPAHMVRRPSLDGRWHVCFDASEKPAILCVFEPPNS